MFPYLALLCVTVVEAVFDCLSLIAQVVPAPEGFSARPRRGGGAVGRGGQRPLMDPSGLSLFKECELSSRSA